MTTTTKKPRQQNHNHKFLCSKTQCGSQNCRITSGICILLSKTARLRGCKLKQFTIYLSPLALKWCNYCQCLSLKFGWGFINTFRISSVQTLSRVWLIAIPWTAARQDSLSTTNSWSLLKLTSIESVMPSNHLILCCPLLLLPSIFPSIRVFSSESVLHIRWPNYWSYRISPSNEYSGLISFRMDWLDLLAIQETLKSLLQTQGSKSSVLQCSAFFTVQLSHPYMTTG